MRKLMECENPVPIAEEVFAKIRTLLTISATAHPCSLRASAPVWLITVPRLGHVCKSSLERRCWLPFNQIGHGLRHRVSQIDLRCGTFWRR